MRPIQVYSKIQNLSIDKDWNIKRKLTISKAKVENCCNDQCEIYHLLFKELTHFTHAYQAQHPKLEVDAIYTIFKREL